MTAESDETGVELLSRIAFFTCSSLAVYRDRGSEGARRTPTEERRFPNARSSRRLYLPGRPHARHRRQSHHRHGAYTTHLDPVCSFTSRGHKRKAFLTWHSRCGTPGSGACSCSAMHCLVVLCPVSLYGLGVSVRRSLPHPYVPGRR